MKKNLFLLAACVGIGMGAIALPVQPAHAQEVGTMYYYELDEAELRDNYQEWRRFVDYHVYREACQSYVAPPEGYVVKGCHVYRVDRKYVAESTPQPQVTQEYHTIYFDFDKSDIRENQRQNLANIAEDLRRMNIEEVTVMAHTDRAGDAAYNQLLSERRGNTVARALADYGIRASFIEEQAFGETSPAVLLGDGVKSQENRRVVIKYKN
ncbi:MAG: OmpA family protein [Alphaproteobacteria bacterium]|nr:OmpA family protein [Alphaproteobacteria bacterium]